MVEEGGLSFVVMNSEVVAKALICFAFCHIQVFKDACLRRARTYFGIIACVPCYACGICAEGHIGMYVCAHNVMLLACVPLRSLRDFEVRGLRLRGPPPQTFVPEGRSPIGLVARAKQCVRLVIGGQWVRLSLRSAAWERFLVGPDELLSGKAGGHHDPSSRYT